MIPDSSLLRKAPNILACRRLARKRLPRFLFEWLDGGTGREDAIQRNEDAFREVLLLPHVGKGVTAPTTSVTMLGREWSLPIEVSPCAYADMIWPGSEIETAKAARFANAPFIGSLSSIQPFEKLVEAAEESFWLQVLSSVDRELTKSTISRAKACGIQTLVVLFDMAFHAKRDRDIRNGFVLPLRPSLSLAIDLTLAPQWCLARLGLPNPVPGNFAEFLEPDMSAADAAVAVEEKTNFVTTWEDLHWFRDNWNGKLVVKGIMRPKDARRAVDIGVDAVMVSNHGGRQYDASPATIDMLPGVAEEIGHKVPVFIDSGVRNGLDVLRALARGASAAFSGRSFYFATAALGKHGSQHAFAILRQELVDSLRQHGLASIESIKEHLPLEHEK